MHCVLIFLIGVSHFDAIKSVVSFKIPFLSYLFLAKMFEKIKDILKN